LGGAVFVTRYVTRDWCAHREFGLRCNAFNLESMCSSAVQAILGSRSIHTAETCGAFHHELIAGADGAPRVGMRADPNTSRDRSCLASSIVRAFPGNRSRKLARHSGLAPRERLVL